MCVQLQCTLYTVFGWLKFMSLFSFLTQQLTGRVARRCVSSCEWWDDPPAGQALEFMKKMPLSLSLFWFFSFKFIFFLFLFLFGFETTFGQFFVGIANFKHLDCRKTFVCDIFFLTIFASIIYHGSGKITLIRPDSEPHPTFYSYWFSKISIFFEGREEPQGGNNPLKSPLCPCLKLRPHCLQWKGRSLLCLVRMCCISSLRSSNLAAQTEQPYHSRPSPSTSDASNLGGRPRYLPEQLGSRRWGILSQRYGCALVVMRIRILDLHRPSFGSGKSPIMRIRTDSDPHHCKKIPTDQDPHHRY